LLGAEGAITYSGPIKQMDTSPHHQKKKLFGKGNKSNKKKPERDQPNSPLKTYVLRSCGNNTTIISKTLVENIGETEDLRIVS